ncbi:MAG TPA: right-handed parallel beta-helix repeat-containing protein, partial [Verrucomicrobiae bacterium]|nr:right-handed parallel beta-helix repeat-containing protein [Verrucomicrobiae bacterium]
GNVSFSYDSGIQFLGDNFVHLGGAGLELGDGSQSDTVEGCVFTDISANGLELGGVNLPEGDAGQLTRDNRIANNHIYNVAAEFHGGVGIDVGYAQRTLIEHNQLDHLPYSGISLGWGGWPDKIQRAGVANNSRDNLVANNLIFDHMQLLADGGGIYMQGLTGPSLANGEKLIGNVIYNQLGSGHGIYTDNGCNNVTAKGNVVFHINFDNWGGRHKNYYDGGGKTSDYFDCEDNYWQQDGTDSSAENVTLKNNRIISKLDQAPAEILQNAGLQSAFKKILDRQFGNPAAPEPPSRVAAFAGNGFALVAWNPSVFEGGAPVQSYTAISSKGEKATIPIAEFNVKGYAKISGIADSAGRTFAVMANNANGTSAPSLPSEIVTPNSKPITPPSAPASASVSIGDGMATIHFAPPDNDGGSPVLAYAVTVNPGGRKVMFTGRKVLVLGGRHVTFDVVDGLENGKTYTFDVAAVNSAGEGAAKTTKA